MNWGSLLTSIIPTIGTVVGQLFGANQIEDGIISYSFKGADDAEPEFQSAFFREYDEQKKEERYYLCNQSIKKDDQIVLSFPARGIQGVETLILSGRDTFDITNMFQTNAQADSTQFELCGSSAQAQGSNKSGVKIISSAREIPVGGAKQSIGSYLDVSVQKNQIEISGNNATIQSLPLVYIQGSGDTAMRIIDAQGQGGKAVIQLPQPLKQDDNVTVEVTANVNGINVIKSGAFFTADNSLIERLNNAPKLNW